MKLSVWLVGLILSTSVVACGVGDPAHPGEVDGVATGTRSPSKGSTDEGTSDSAAGPTDPSKAGGGSGETAPPETGFASPADQLLAGETTFSSTCSRCHGADGAGGRAPRLVGRSAGALGAFSNAEEVASYVASNMPVSSKVEAYAVVAYVMKKNGVDVGDRILDEKVAPTIALH